MAQCKGTTKAGSRCKRQAREGSEFCSIHVSTEPRERPQGGKATWELNDTLKVMVGIALFGALAYLFGGLRGPKDIFGR